jgi:hypothetical protein
VRSRNYLLCIGAILVCCEQTLPTSRGGVPHHDEAVSRAILCDEGDVPISGFGGLAPESRIISSRRIVLGDEDAWLVAVRSSGSDTFVVQAVCTDFPPI